MKATQLHRACLSRSLSRRVTVLTKQEAPLGLARVLYSLDHPAVAKLAVTLSVQETAATKIVHRINAESTKLHLGHTSKLHPGFIQAQSHSATMIAAHVV